MEDEFGYYIYRLPETTSIIAAKGTIKEGLHPGGFVVHPFDSSLFPIFTIEKIKELDLDTFPFDELEGVNLILEKETSSDEHIHRVSNVIAQLCEGEKCVLCRNINHSSGNIALKKSFLSLLQAFPHAMVYCFFSSVSGCWIGASPELLLRKKGIVLTSMALAGTRKAESNIRAWDNKNIEEQEIVTHYIADVLQHYCNHVKISNSLSTHKAGMVEHLRTDINAELSNVPDALNIGSLLEDLTPTPALCGYPKEKARRIINNTESFSREYYGGFIGPYGKDGDFDYFVLLRSLKIGKDGWCFYAGGGITPSSIPEEELKETERKANSILKYIIQK